MSVVHFDTLEAALTLNNGAEEVSATSALHWSGKEQPPALEALVTLHFNGLGLARVTGYFVEDGFLGLTALPLDPPEWFIRQQGYNTPAYVFGRECGPATETEPQNRPNLEQLAAMQQFATTHGATWKDKLLTAWATGRDAAAPFGHLLRQVRNTFGPQWLNSADNKVVPLDR